MQNKAKALLPVALLSAAALNMTPVFAQDSEAILEEVIVTAQRRAQNLQEVPISVTAFSGAAIERQNVKSAIDFLALTPNVSFTEDGQSGSRGLGIAIRGINNLVSGENAFVNSVGIYLDEFSVASVPNQVANPNLADMERVEVLRGPQGTFFGRNALGGALNMTTNKPTDEFGGRVILGAEDYANAGGQYNVTAILNLPVSDTFKLRGLVYYEDSDGWVQNACATGSNASTCPAAAENGFTPNGTADSGHETLTLRLHAAWDVAEYTTILGSLHYTDEEQGTDENVPSGVLDIDSIDSFGLTRAIDPGTGFWPGNQNTLSHDLPERTDNKSLVGILNVTHELNNRMVLKWITGFIDADLDRVFDNDLAGGADTLVRTNAYRGKSWSSELRLEVSGENYDFIGGVLYAQDEQKQDNNVAISTQATATVGGVGWLPPFPEGLGLALNQKKWSVDSIAVFADFTHHTTDNLDLIVGARLTKDDVTNELQAYGIGPTCCFPGSPGFPGGPGFEFFQSFDNFARPPVSESNDFTDISPRFVARYQVNDDVNVYGNISKGYKAGGVAVGNNTNADGQPGFGSPFNEETLWNYEIGFKGEFMNQRVRLNGSLFYLDWSDLQLESFRFLTPGDLSSNFEQVTTAESARAKGIELELIAAVTDRFTIMSSIGFLDTKITSDTVAEITGGFEVHLQGLAIPKAPELTFNFIADYRFPVGENEGWFLIEYIHRDGQFSDIEGLTYLQTDGPSPNGAPARDSVATHGAFPFRTPDYNLFNVRGGFDMKNINFTVYIQNLFEEEYYTGTQENFGVSGMRLRPHPRILGFNVGYNF
jgi:iron complex outermembrane receptor protein